MKGKMKDKSTTDKHRWIQIKDKKISEFIGVHLWFQILLFSLIIVSSGCSGSQSALAPGGVQSERLFNLGQLFFWVCVAVYVIVMAVLLIAFFRVLSAKKRSSAETAPDVKPDQARENRLGNIIKGAVAVTLIALFTLMVFSFRTGRAINQLSNEPQPLLIKIKGHQWWWEVEYTDEAQPSNNISTANEIHVPVGRPIKLLLQSTDVIHSFWIPNLHGKKDLIPNYNTATWFEADKPGV